MYILGHRYVAHAWCTQSFAGGILFRFNIRVLVGLYTHAIDGSTTYYIILTYNVAYYTCTRRDTVLKHVNEHQTRTSFLEITEKCQRMNIKYVIDTSKDLGLSSLVKVTGSRINHGISD